MKRHSYAYTVVAVLLLGLFATILTLLIPNTIHDNSELEDAGFGWPAHFVLQDSSRWPFGGDGLPLPNSRPLLSPWELPTTFLIPQFVLNMAVWCGVFGFLAWLIHKQRVKTINSWASENRSL